MMGSVARAGSDSRLPASNGSNGVLVLRLGCFHGFQNGKGGEGSKAWRRVLLFI